MFKEERERENRHDDIVYAFQKSLFYSFGDDFCDSPLENKIVARYDHLFGEIPCRLII